MSRARYSAPSANAAIISFALCTTWLLVSRNPSGVNTKPEPAPAPLSARTMMCATDGRTSRATWLTVRE